ncbi:MAG: hypothetical protein JXA71_20415 [Chitinispirillaceae bacterium]|nr:hypothetical protein [Chitinispirillaceae bacterium]
MIQRRFRTMSGLLAAAMVSVSGPGIQAAEFPHFFFAEEPVNVRASSMGGVGAALDGGGFSHYNPASMALAGSPFVAVEYGQQGGGLSKSLIETAWMFPSWFAGASFPVQSTDWQTGTEQGVGAMSTNQMFGPTVAGGYQRERFATGHAFSWLSERIGDYTINAVTYSTGVTYRIIPGSLVAGASLVHYLRFDSARTPWTRAPRGWYRDAVGLPRMVRGGIAWTDTLVSGVPSTVAADLLYRDFDDRLVMPTGVEVWVLPSIAARAGKRLFDPRGDLLHAGCGIRWRSLAFDFDYGFSRPVKGATLEPKWLFGLTYSIPSRRPAESTVTTVPAADKGPVEKETIPVAPPKPAMTPGESPSRSGQEPVPVHLPDTAVAREPADASHAEERALPSAPADVPEVSPVPADSTSLPDSSVSPVKQE